MKNEQLNRLLKIAARTKDPVLILDRDTDATFAVMELDRYEQMLDMEPAYDKMSEGEILDKINRDIAVWRSRQESENVDDCDGGLNCWSEPVSAPERDILAESQVKSNFSSFKDILHGTAPVVEPLPEPTVVPITEPVAEKVDETANLSPEIPVIEDRSNEEEVDLSDVPHDEEPDKFYLEPV